MRKVALLHTISRTKRPEYKMPSPKSKTYWLRRPIFLHSFIERTIGTGMIWKEFLHPVLGRFRWVVYGTFAAMAALFMLSIMLAVFAESIYLFSFVLIVSIFTLTLLAILFTIILPASCITTEKEAGTWLILMTTCYTDWQIIGAKIFGILRRILLFWLPFVLIFYMVSYFFVSPVWMTLQLCLAVFVAAIFVIASGLYLSSRLRHSTAAVIFNLSLAALLWIGLPSLIELFNNMFFHYKYAEVFEFLDLYWYITPPGMIQRIMENADSAEHYSPGRELNLWMVYIGIYAVLSILFIWRAKINLRKRIV